MEQKIKDREKELLTNISLNFNRENDYIAASIGLCQTIGIFGKFDWVEVWTVNIKRSKVQYTGHYLQDSSNEVFYEETEGYNSFEKGSGLPGQVWQQKNQVLWSELDDTKDFSRKEAAKKINIKTVLGLPLINQNEVIGVILVGSKQGIETLEKYAGLFANLHNFIGAEINRKKLETDLNHLYESIPDIVCISDFQGRFLKLNRSGCELLGYTEEEMLYHSFDEFVFAADKDLTARELANQAKGEPAVSFENRFVQKNGEICWLSWTANVNLKEGLIYSTAKNITREKKLRELNSLTSKMARIGSWDFDRRKNKIFWSEMVHQLHETDYRNFEPELTQIIDFYREDFRPIITEAINQCIQSGTPIDFEAVIVTANKNELWVRAIGNAEFVNGECIRICGSFQDINERKQAAEKLKKAYQETNNIIESIADAFFTMDRNFIVSYWNRAAEEIIGIKREQLIGKCLWDVFPDAKELLSYTNYIQVLATGKAITFEDYYGLWLEVNAYPSEEGLTVFFRDISLRKEADQRLLKAFEEKNNILESIGDAFFSVTREWIVTYWNKETEKVLGKKREDIVGKNLLGGIC